ncbi:iron ABC transporter permease [Candidatus Bathyarchaeota archaeon]|nr:MAG: iron ABC transporter permease [Candidatus Bathyarchaeota archaeon]
MDSRKEYRTVGEEKMAWKIIGINLSGIVISCTLIAFLIFVVLPSFYLISYIFLRWDEVWYEVFANPITGDENWRQIIMILLFSFKLSLSAVAFDLVFGVPLAYVLARKKFPGKNLLEDLVTLPLVIPTSGFGFATLITWTSSSGLSRLFGSTRLLSMNTAIPLINVPFILFIVHVALTFPYLVRTVETKIQSIEETYEIASRTLGASSLTTFRKVLLPLSIPGIFSGSVLAFARSLGETGATIIVSGVSTTASIAIVRWASEFKLSTAAFMGSLLVLIAWIMILPVEIYVSKNRRSSWRHLHIPTNLSMKIIKFERFLSRKLSIVKDIVPLIIVVILIIIPVVVVISSVTLYWSADPYTGRVEGGVVYQLFGPSRYLDLILRATLTSVIVASISTYIATCISIPLSFIIERRRYGHVLRTMLKVPLIIPTSSLGLSVLLLWGASGLCLVNSGIWMIILTHIVFSVPVIVESIIAAYEGSGVQMYEETARTLGANAYSAIEAVSLPLIKGGIFTGFILSFTHSLGETGATLIVMGRDTTIPVLVVNMVEALAIPAALFTSTYLIVLSLVMLVIIRILTQG